MKKGIVLLLFFCILIPNVLANRIELNQDWGWIVLWDEHKYIIDSDLLVESKITLSLSRILNGI